MTSLNFEIAYDILKNSIGREYRIDCQSLSEEDDFTICRGNIEEVFVDDDNVLRIKLSGYDQHYENFMLNRIKIFETTIKEKFSIIKIIYNDNSYFKVYVGK